MAIYHFSAKPIKRSAGRSAVGAAAYRAGVEITDERTGVVHDYTRKGGVLHSELILPGGGTADRAEFWNGIESHHKRGDAVLVREVEVSLPVELTAEQRQELAVDYARELADRYGVAADVALHAPRKITDRDLEKNPEQYHEHDADGHRHNGNWHAHIMLSACSVQPDGTLGKKAVELDPIHCQKNQIQNMADRERARWGELANAALERHGHQARIDHRSHAERGIEAEPTRHLGPTASEIERRTGQSKRRQQMRDQDITERLTRAKELGQLERERDELKASILDLSGDLAAAKTERDRMASEASKRAVEASAAVAVSRYGQALKNVTWETLATVPGLLPVPAIKQAIQQVAQEVQAESQVQEVDVEAVRRQVQAQPALQVRLLRAKENQETAKATLEDVASMGFIKRQLNDTKWMTEQAHKLQEEAKHDRAQVAAAVEQSPQVQAALKANEQAKQARSRAPYDAQELEKMVARSQPGQAPCELAKHEYKLEEVVKRVMDKARAIAPNSLQGMQLAELERMTAKAADVAWKAPDTQNEYQVRKSRFVVPAEQRRQLQQQQHQEKSQERDSSPGMPM